MPCDAFEPPVQMKLFVEITFLPGNPMDTLLMDRKFVSDLGNIVNRITHCHYDTIDWTTFGLDNSKQQHNAKVNLLRYDGLLSI